MLGIRVDRLLASTAIALLLAIPATGTFAGSENNADTSVAPRQETPTGEASQAAASEPVQKVSNDAAAGAAKPEDVGTAASNSVTGEAKPAAASDAVQPDQPAKSAAGGKPADTKPADAKPVDAKVDAKPGDAAPAAGNAPAATNAPAAAAPEAPLPAATAAAPAAAGPDAAISEQLRELGNGKFDRIIGSKKDRTQIETFYSSRNYAPLWIADGKANARAKAAIG